MDKWIPAFAGMTKERRFVRTFFVAVFLGLLFFPTFAFAKDARIVQAESWLRTLKTAQARFMQRAPDGSTLHGDFYISRPGRLRFQYDKPVTDFIVADGTFLFFYDGAQNQMSNAPIGTTLADFLLRKDPRLDGDLIAKNVRERDGLISMTVTQAADPSAGQLTLNFTKDPFNLKSWTIIDAQGLTTDIVLTNLRLGVPVDPALFVFKDPSGRGRLND